MSEAVRLAARGTVRCIASGSSCNRGFIYLALLFSIAVMSVALAAVGVLWSQAAQREKEKELLFIGDQFRRAIAAYYEDMPMSGKQYPRSLEELLLDPRRPGVRRYLRKIYRDPMTGTQRWGTIAAPDGGIMGVYSLSGELPLKQANFRTVDVAFEGARQYSDWRFMYLASGMLSSGGQSPRK